MNLSTAVVHHGTAGAQKAVFGKAGSSPCEEATVELEPAKDVQNHAESETRPGLKGLDHRPLSRPSVLSEDSL